MSNGQSCSTQFDMDNTKVDQSELKPNISQYHTLAQSTSIGQYTTCMVQENRYQEQMVIKLFNSNEERQGKAD